MEEVEFPNSRESVYIALLSAADVDTQEPDKTPTGCAGDDFRDAQRYSVYFRKFSSQSTHTECAAHVNRDLWCFLGGEFDKILCFSDCVIVRSTFSTNF